MASFSIEPRQLKDGSKSYRCKVRIKKSGRIIHTESKTFTSNKAAAEWGDARVKWIELNGVPGQGHNMPSVISISDLIDLYMSDKDLWNSTGRTKQYVIRMLRDCDISRVKTDNLSSRDLISHCRDRRDAGTSPATIYHDVIYLKSLFKIAPAVFGIRCNMEAFDQGMPAMFKMGLIGRAERRTRRPTDSELERLKLALKERESQPGSTIPLTDILDFSILTCMRISEVCGLQWDDLDQDRKSVIVRNRKDPRKKAGNHMTVPLLGDSFDIVMRQPRAGRRIFPCEPKSVTSAFQRVRSKLGITDLRYHDLRREGASRLFEIGYGIEDVAQVTGHRDLNTLWQIYTQLDPHKLHDKQKELFKK